VLRFGGENAGRGAQTLRLSLRHNPLVNSVDGAFKAALNLHFRLALSGRTGGHAERGAPRSAESGPRCFAGGSADLHASELRVALGAAPGRNAVHGIRALAGLLTVVGLYGVISYSVGQRTRELGIRMALGAQPSTVLWQVLAEGMILVFWGLVLGLVAAVTVAGVLNSLLFGVSSRDPLTLEGTTRRCVALSLAF
jgi:FtsX-like permease family protein